MCLAYALYLGYSGLAPLNHWYLLIERLIQDWKAQFGDQLMPTAHFNKELNDYLVEQKRQNRYWSRGVVKYGVKGEEFKHVFVLDGGWRQCFGAGLGEVARQEEEGRLYYVAMTSAVDQLIVFSLSEGSNPYLVLLDINNCRDIYSSESERLASLTQFYTTDLSQINLSYAAKVGTQHLKHNVLQGLLVGDTVDVDSDIGGKIFIRSQGGNCLFVCCRKAEN